MIEHTFPADGEYEIQVRLQRNRNENVEGLTEPHEVEITLDGERLSVFTMEPSQNFVLQANSTYYADEGIDNHLNVSVSATAGPHAVGATFIKKNSALIETTRQPYDAHFNMDRHPRQQPAVRSVSIVGPFDPTGVGETPSRQRVFSCRPASGSAQAEEDCATAILATLARRAYRRPVTVDDLDQLVAFYHEGHGQGGFEAGIETALRALLASPEFLFRIERDPDGAAPGEPYRISDLELASRLSFFLWSSLPDEELLDAAAAGGLSDPATLRTQVERMLADPRAGTLTTNFASQWLHLRNLDAVRPDARLFPDFDDNLRQGFREETELLFRSILDEDRSVVDLLTADYTFVNERVARHYGFDGVYGDHFRRVQLPDGSPRAGLLGHGSILTVTSYATRDFPRAARQVDSREPARDAAAAAAGERAAARGDPLERAGGLDAREDGGAPPESAVRRLSPDHGSGRIVDGELRRHRPLAGRRARNGDRRGGKPAGRRGVRRRRRATGRGARAPGGLRRNGGGEAADLRARARPRPRRCAGDSRDYTGGRGR